MMSLLIISRMKQNQVQTQKNYKTPIIQSTGSIYHHLLLLRKVWVFFLKLTLQQYPTFLPSVPLLPTAPNRPYLWDHILYIKTYPFSILSKPSYLPPLTRLASFPFYAKPPADSLGMSTSTPPFLYGPHSIKASELSLIKLYLPRSPTMYT